MKNQFRSLAFYLGTLTIFLVQPSYAVIDKDLTQQPPHTLTLAERAQRLEIIKHDLAGVLTDFTAHALQANSSAPTLRDLTNAALATLTLGQDPANAEALLKLAFAQQDMDESSKSYGSVPWQMGHPEIVDLNSDEFTTQALGPILTLYGNKISPEFTKEIHKHAHAFLAAMNRRVFKTPAYTNIYLMRAVNMILLGEAVQDPIAANEGYKQLDAWIAYTKANGIHEFDSPTYYYCDLDSLSMGYALTQRPEGKLKFKAILDYFWTDIAANYFVQRGCISGANSRNYDFLHSWGGIDYALLTEGFRSSSNLGKPDFEKALWIAIPNEKAYRPDEQIRDLTKLPLRIVRQRWDADPQHDRYQYLTPDFSISSSNGDYGAQDKQIAIELASPHKTPVITVVPDTFDSPFGKIRSLDKSGHNKPTHLKLNPTILQEKNIILALIDLDPARDHVESETLATNILLPALAQKMMIDHRTINLTEGMNEKLSMTSILGIREGNAAAVIRIFRADSLDNQPPPIELKCDKASVKDGVARLAIYHYRGSKFAIPQSNIRVGLLLMASPASTDAQFENLIDVAKNAPIQQASDQKTWSAQVQIAGITLSAAHDLKKHTTTFRKVNGTPVESQALEINGEDWATKIWSTLAK